MFEIYLASLSLIYRSHDYLGFLYVHASNFYNNSLYYLAIICANFLLLNSSQLIFLQTFANNAVATWAGPIMTILVAISALGSLSAHIMTSSRLCFVGARKGHIPTCLSLVSVKHSTPEPALIFLVSAILKSDRLFTSRTANRVCVPSAPASTTEPPDTLPR